VVDRIPRAVIGERILILTGATLLVEQLFEQNISLSGKKKSALGMPPQVEQGFFGVAAAIE